MYQIYDTYVDTHFDILIHHDLVIICLQFDTLRLNRWQYFYLGYQHDLFFFKNTVVTPNYDIRNM
jgi:hypothetical protein